MILLAACGGDDEGGTGPEPGSDREAVATTVAISPDPAMLTAIGDSVALSAEVRDQDGQVMADAAVTWTSLNTDVAAVGTTGTVRAAAAGEARIVAKSGAAADTATVIVAPEAEAVVVTPDTLRLNALGDSLRLEASFRDSGGNAFPAGAADVEWTSVDEAVATVSDAGWVTSVAVGTTRIAATAGTLGDTVEVEVRQVPGMVSLSISGDTLAEGESVVISAGVADSNGYAMPGAEVVWTTSDPTAADVDDNGKVTAVRGDAVATVTATAGSLSADAEITVLGRIAFMSSRSGNSGIYVMNSDGTGVDSLTATTAIDGHPAWSPDGTMIAFFSHRSGDGEIWVIGAAGGTPTNVSNSTESDMLPAWSPDGARIAFASYRDANSEIYSMAADGTDQRRLTDDAAFDSQPAWSPDGTKLAFVSNRGGQYDIWVMNATDGSDAQRLTNDTREDVDPAWSPDGTRIVFASRTGVGEDFDIWIMDADGSNAVQLTDNDMSEEMPSWSPDGSRIVFAGDAGGDRELYVMDVDGSNVRKITNSSGANGDPDWRLRP